MCHAGISGRAWSAQRHAGEGAARAPRRLHADAAKASHLQFLHVLVRSVPCSADSTSLSLRPASLPQIAEDTFFPRQSHPVLHFCMARPVLALASLCPNGAGGKRCAVPCTAAQTPLQVSWLSPYVAIAAPAASTRPPHCTSYLLWHITLASHTACACVRRYLKWRHADQ